MGDPLVGLNERIDWEAFREDLSRVHEKKSKSNAGAKPIDVVLMFKVLVLQQLHNMSNDRIEYQVRDRLSFMRFLGLQLEDRVPDAKTVWLFREQLKNKGLVTTLFARFHEQLARQGYVAKSGQMIDATFIEAPRQRNTREENDQIKADEAPVDWQKPECKAKLRQKDGLVKLGGKLMDTSGEEAESNYRSATTLLAALATLLACGFAYWTTRSITLPLNREVQIAQTMAAGDLTSKIEAGSADETGQLLRALKDMNGSLENIVGQVRSGTRAESGKSCPGARSAGRFKAIPRRLGGDRCRWR